MIIKARAGFDHNEEWVPEANSSWEVGVCKVLGVGLSDQVVKVSSGNELAIATVWTQWSCRIRLVRSVTCNFGDSLITLLVR